MQEMTLTVPADSLIGVRIPPRELNQELLRRLAAALYSDGILSGASACRMATMTKPEFHHMLGEQGISQPIGDEQYTQDARNLKTWRAC